MIRISKKSFLGMGLAGLMMLLGGTKAQAIPSFARQTGMSCAACHTVFPELTSFGRTFKLNGYTMTNTDELKDSTDTGGTRLEVNNTPPISAMLQLSDAFVKKPASTAAGTADMASDQDGSLEFPTQFSLFYGGRISPQMGAFVQFTYDAQSGSFGWDNTDVRFADSLQVANTDLVYGLTANNNPTVQDVFNTIPAWSFPYFAAKSGMGPLASTQLESLGGNVGGVGGYVFWNQLLYAEISAYRSAPQGFGGAGPDSYNAIQGFAPYWRVALTQDFDKNSAEVGIFGLDEHSIPNTELILGPQDHFNDFGVDAQYQYVTQEHCFTLKGSEIWENQTWDYSNGVGLTGGGAIPANPADTLRSFKVDATYYYNRMIGATVGYFSTTGSADGGLYPASSNAALTPDTEGYIAEINFVPWYDTKFALQYTYFTKFNGSVDNYAVAGDHATDNDTLVASAWFSY